MSSGGKIIFVLLIVVLLGIGLYLYNSGTLSKGFQSFNSLIKVSSSTHLFPSVGGGGFSAPIGPTLPQTTIEPAGGSSPSSTSTVNPANIPPGFTAAQLSPYFGEISFSEVTPATSYGSYGQIELYAYFNTSESVDITGWQIKSRDGGEYIPQAVNVYDPSGLTPPSDIRMKSGDEVYLFSTSAPFNLRLNECMGYIAHIANFNPPLPVSCPQVDQSAIQNLTGACQNYIYQNLGTCQVPNMADPHIPQNDNACRDYLENNFTYKSCFEQHAADADFLSNQVWVWTGSNVVDEYHDQVELLDKNGFLVSIYTY